MYRINKIYEMPAHEQLELPKSMYQVKPVNGNAAGLYSMANGNGETSTRTALNESNRNPVKNANHSVQGKSAAAKRKRSNSRSPSRVNGNAPAPVKKDVNKPKNANMTKEKQSKSGDEDAVREQIIAKLEARQKQVIEKLIRLRDMLDSMGAGSATAGVDSGSGQGFSGELNSSLEVVVKADPANPPYSVLFLAKLLRESYGPGSLSLQSYRHSSCSATPTEDLQVFNQPAEVNIPLSKRIKVSVIWRQVEDGTPELLVSPTVQATVTGEANIARYLSRLLPSVYPIHYDTLSWDDIIRVDAALEKANDGITNLKDVDAQLQNNQPFLLGEATIADFVLFSAVTGYIKKNPTNRNQFPRVFQWYDACQNFGGFRL